MVRPGKEHAVAQDQHEAPETVQDTRWLNGVNRQLRPDAQSQRQAASQAAAEKRKAAAMPVDERKRKRAEHAKFIRAQEKAAREAAAVAAAAERELTLQQLNDELQAAHEEAHPDDPEDCSSVDEDEWDAFRAWVAEEEDELNRENCIEFYEAWSEPYGGPREKWERRSLPSAGVAAPTQPKLPPPPPAPDDDPDDPWGGASADCFYEGPNDHDIAHQRERQERLRHEQPGYVRVALTQQSFSLKLRLRVVREDYNDGYELDQERLYNDDARRSCFYGVPAGELPPSTAAPLGWVPPSCLPAGENTVPRPRRDNVAVYGPLANNPEGDRAFRKDRAMWYESITGQRLTGTLTEQWEEADVLARSFRVDHTRSGRAK